MDLLPDDARLASFALTLQADSIWTAYHEMMLMPESAREAVQAGGLSDLPVIALITPAEEDGSFPEHYQERFLALSSNSRVSVLDCGHYVHWEQPELVLEAIRELAAARIHPACCAASLDSSSFSKRLRAWLKICDE